jgi:hypothetical protein
MITNDLSHWPLVLTESRGRVTLDEQILFLETWAGWLDRGEHFATFKIFADMQALERPDGGVNAAKTWLQENAERIKRLVIGVATVIPDRGMEEHGKFDAEKLFGVPARTFTTANDGLIWILSLMAARGFVLDGAQLISQSDRQGLFRGDQ